MKVQTIGLNQKTNLFFTSKSITDQELEKAVQKHFSFSFPIEKLSECCDSIEDVFERQQLATAPYTEAELIEKFGQDNYFKYINERNFSLKALLELRELLCKFAMQVPLGFNYKDGIAYEYGRRGSGRVSKDSWSAVLASALNAHKQNDSTNSTSKVISNTSNLQILAGDSTIEESLREKWFNILPGMEKEKTMIWDNVLRPLRLPDPEYDDRPTGMVLFGPPGCGKTYTADKMAEYLNCKVIKLSIGAQGSSYINTTSVNLKGKIDEARRIAKDEGLAIIFIDEADSLLTSRKDLPSSAGYRKDDVNTLLKEVEDAGKDGVFSIAATNHADSLDEAATRPGRFTYKMFIDLPDEKTRMSILNHYLLKKPPGQKLANNEMALRETALLLEGFSNADIAKAIIPSAFQLARPNREAVSFSHFKEVISFEEIKILFKERAAEWQKYGVDKLLRRTVKRTAGFAT